MMVSNDSMLFSKIDESSELTDNPKFGLNNKN